MDFKDNLRFYREQAGLTGRQLAQQIGLPYSTYNKYEIQNTEAKYEVLRKIATALGVTTDALIGHETDPIMGWLHEKFVPALRDSAIIIGDIGADTVTLNFRDKTWTISIKELQIIYNTAVTEIEKNEQGKVLYRCLLEYFATH